MSGALGSLKNHSIRTDYMKFAILLLIFENDEQIFVKQVCWYFESMEQKIRTWKWTGSLVIYTKN